MKNIAAVLGIAAVSILAYAIATKQLDKKKLEELIAKMNSVEIKELLDKLKKLAIKEKDLILDEAKKMVAQN